MSECSAMYRNKLTRELLMSGHKDEGLNLNGSKKKTSKQI